MVNLLAILSILNKKAERLGVDKSVTIDGSIDTDTGEYCINFYFKYSETSNYVQAATAHSVSTANAFLLIFAAGRGKG